VLLTRERIQEAMDDAVDRGRMTRSDAEDLVSSLARLGRKQSEDVIADLEQLVGRGRDQLESAATDARRRVVQTRKRARGSSGADRALREVDRARRAVGVGSSFPVLGYDDLTAGQIADRVADLTPAQLRKVRDYERRHANRKSVLQAIERGL
jgi:polyhydroxyalkanoate synthesis regulator phasin